VAVAPHFETFGHRWVDSVLGEPPAEDVVIVGIDERSAALWDGRAWTARGPGRITVVTRRDRGVYQPGTPVQLPAPRAAPLPTYQRRYAGDQYPRVEQQVPLHTQSYRYQPKEAVVREHYQEQRQQQREGRGEGRGEARGQDRPHGQQR